MTTPRNAKSTPHTSLAPGVQLKGRSARPSLSAGAKHEAGHAFTSFCFVNLVNREGFPAMPFRSDAIDYATMLAFS